MDELIRLFGVLIDGLRVVFLFVLAAAALGAAAALAERARYVNAFGSIARFARQVMDPLIAPVERRAVRFGGTHTNAPLWWLFALLVAGALTLGVLGFVQAELMSVRYASRSGPRGLLRLAVAWTFTVLQLAILARVVMSWVGGTYSRLGRLIVGMTEWLLGPLRRVLPTFGAIDISPLVAWFALAILQALVMRVL
jgi:YggT family protein